MSFEYIRKFYKVPAQKGARVRYKADNIKGTIIGFFGHYLKVRPDGKLGYVLLHPTWKIDYLPNEKGKVQG